MEQIALAHRNELASLTGTGLSEQSGSTAQSESLSKGENPPAAAEPVSEQPASAEPAPLHDVVTFRGAGETQGPYLEETPHAEAAAPPDVVVNATVERDDIESVAARRKIRSRASRRRSPVIGLPSVVLALIAINVGLIAWRTEIVRLLPQTASLYAAIKLPVNVRGLSFVDIATRRETQDGVPVLIVEGFIKNESHRIARVPRLRFAVRNTHGNEIYAWTSLPARSLIPSGAMLPFRSRLASPPPEMHDVLVRFWNKRDLMAGL